MRLLLSVLLMPFFVDGTGAQDRAEHLPISDSQLAELVKKLGDDDFHVRRDAHKKIASHGRAILPQLGKLEEPDDFEIRWRLLMIKRDLSIVALAGSRWRLIPKSLKDGPRISLSPSTIAFRKDFTFLTDKGDNREPDTWDPNPSHNFVRFRFNSGYSTYEGKFLNDDTMTGEARNVTGKKWRWTAIRLAK